MKIRKQTIGGQIRNAQEESFDTTREDWNTYELESGTKVRVKLSVQKIFRLVDDQGNPLFSADGDPEIAVRHQVQIVASGGPEPMSEGEVH